MIRQTAVAVLLGILPLGLAAMGDGPDPDGLLEITGELRDGVECPLIVTESGTVFALSHDGDWQAGETVRLSGSLVSMSICMEGEGTIRVNSMEPL
jgi:hypothetical protein